MLDVKQLRVLKEVAEQGSFSAAAEALSYTQPAISQQVASLEKRVGATLVERTSRGVRLTDAGRALVDHATVVMARLSAAEAELEAIAGARGGRVRLASFPTAGAAIVPRAVALFSERHPNVELGFVEAEPDDSIAMLRAGDLELAIVFDYRHLPGVDLDRLFEGVELHPLMDDPMYLAVPRGHPVAGKARVRLDDLSDETWIQEADPSSPCGRVQTAACAAAGFAPKIGFMSDDYNVVQGLVAARVGVSLLPSLALNYVRDDIVVRSLGRRAPFRQIVAATLAGRYRSPAAGAMLGILQEVAADFVRPSGSAESAA